MGGEKREKKRERKTKHSLEQRGFLLRNFGRFAHLYFVVVGGGGGGGVVRARKRVGR